MALTPGARLGQYEIAELIGAGGMGEVYRAFDRTLNRPVAIKVLPELVAGDPDRLARFEREAQVLAALNHPHIAQVYGFERSGPVHALVMELVEGETLEARLAQGPIPVADALQVARQIAEALEAAHEVGIIHRDLKPANVKIRDDDTVKVLDFGLAKALDPKAAGNPDALNSPTLTARATQLGIVLGTAAYMSPEQAKGKAVDRRADVWAFGVVLYEILTGRRLFSGEDVSDTMASVLRQPLDLGALPPAVPAPVRSLIERCIERDTKQRLRDIGEARVLLERVIAGKDSSGPVVRPDVPAPASRRVLPWLLLAAMTLVAAALVALGLPSTSTGPAPVTRVLGAIGTDAVLQIEVGPAAVLSPDGRTIVFRAQKDGTTRLYVRRLDQLQATPLPGTEGAESQFFSPDGQWIAFFAEQQLKKVPLSGGAPIRLCDASIGRGGTWTEDGTIVFQPGVNPNLPLHRVSADGGSPVPASVFGEGEVAHRWPQALPLGKGLLYTGNSGVSGYESGTIRVQTKPDEAGKVVLTGGYHGRYLPSGHLVYIHRGTLYGVRFDLDRLEAVGQPIPLIEGVAATSGTGGAQFSVASNGTLVYVPAGNAGADARLHWMTADGSITPIGATPPDWENLRFSPDGTLLSMDVSDGRHRQIVIYDVEQDQTRQLTFGASNHGRPVWTPDGQRIVYASDAGRPGVFNLYWRRVDGTGDAQRLTDVPRSQFPTSVHPTGRFIAFSEMTVDTHADIWILPLEGGEADGWRPGKPQAFVASPATESNAVFSPDGRWLAYPTSEHGTFEVYVRPFPTGAGQWRVSSDGGIHPVWSSRTSELFFTFRDQIMVAGYTIAGNSFKPGKPRLWARGRYTSRGPARMYDIHPDGKRLALAAPEGNQVPHDKVVFVVNFLDELRRLLPAEQ